MSTICIWGFCFPTYALLPVALIVLQSVWEWVRKNVLGQNDAALFENSRVIHVTSVEQFKELQQKGKDTKRSLVVDFTASWCGPCRFIAPIYHELSNKYPCTIFLKVDVDEMKEIARGCGVSAMPTFQFFRNGTRCDELRGADKNGLEEKIKKHYVEVELPEDEQPKAPESETTADANGATGELRQRKQQPKIVKVTSDEQWKELLDQNRASGNAMIVDFWATWCQPCVGISPVFEALSAKYPSAVFVKVDVDEMEDITNEYAVAAMPTFKVFKGGKVVDELSGAIKSALESMVGKHAAA
ncbi:hypothetical protein Gpo141_00007512 [Globisporangium polare]